MTIIDYHNKKTLIIDHAHQSCFLLKSTISSFGVKHIDTCHNGEKAITFMSNTDYDIILSKYTFGDGRDGQQVLEEAKHLNLIKHGALFIIITAKNKSAMVVSALENQPSFATVFILRQAPNEKNSEGLKIKSKFCEIST